MLVAALLCALLAIGGAIASFTHGGPVERKCAAIAAGMVIAHWLIAVAGLDGARLTEISPALALVDTVILAMLVKVALAADRYYPLTMAAAALVAVTTHSLRFAGLFTERAGYLALLDGTCYIVLVALWVGIFATPRSAPSGPPLA